jgi:predicted SprT family Zn-dependent metalloprotease
MDIDKTFKPTVEWMGKKYDEMNMQLFNNELGDCNFAIFTTGRGSEGGVLGWFKITAQNIRANRSDRHMFKMDWGNKIYVTRANFERVCKPSIELNGNYSGTEHGFLATLVHEMCHYYTYMYGYIPKQGHGREFKEIGAIVSSRSKGMFTIQRIASAEQMSELELSDEMKAKRVKRESNKKSKMNAIFEFRTNGEIHLTTTTNQKLKYEILSTYTQKHVKKILLSNDSSLIDFLFSKGYKHNMRTWRYWNVADKDWINHLNEYDCETYSNKDYDDEGQTISTKSQEPPQEKRQPRRIFSIKTSNGTFECDGSVYNSLFKALREKFPKMSDDTIKKIINNPNNYRMEENKKNMKSVIREVIEEFMQNEFRGANNNDTIEINPNMNLGLHSPLEAE